jgi:rubredoxin
MLVFGSDWDTVPLDLSETRPCPECGANRTFSAQLVYRYTHVFWIFGRVRERHVHWRCNECGGELPGDTRQIEGRLPFVPIPFMRRWGWLVYALGGIALVLFGLWNMIMNDPRYK